jgi:hypothetical protein
MDRIASKEGRMSFAKAAIQRGQIQSIRASATTWRVPRSTLLTRLQGIQPKRGSKAPNRKLSSVEEEILIKWIWQMEQRGYPPYIINVKRMAEALITARGPTSPPTVLGQKWIYRFISSHPDLDPRLTRSLDSQRAKNEDPKVITKWFNRVAAIRIQYGITDDDTFNFDETGFAMGIAIPGASKAVTTASVGRATAIQPGDRKWSTAIECMNALGWTIPPFIILEGRVHLSTWYKENPDIPSNWTIAVSDNGWTTDELGMEFIRHFDRWTRNRVVGKYRLLILDGHGSHATPEFDAYCTENKIITLCMPPHTSHLLQPLDVACFSPLKQAYSRLVQDLARQGIFQVDKADFLGMYCQARTTVFTPQTIASGFRATGLIPFNPDRVISALTITKTPSPPSTSHGQNSSPWTSETPRNLVQLEKQLQLVQDTLQRLSKSPTEPLSKVVKGCQLAMSGAALLAQENRELRAANERLQRKRQVKRHFIQHGGVLQVEQAQDIVTMLDIPIQDEAVRQDPQGRQRAPPTCSNCHIQGHRMTSCRQPRRIR